MAPVRRLVTVTLLCLFAAPAQALCIYHQELYAKTSIAQEFRDSRWVVHAQLLSAETHSPKSGPAWTIYLLRPIESYKGQTPKPLKLFTERNSGGFYMDRGEKVDIGGEYLLFLRIPENGIGTPSGSVVINYACGQSRPWTAVTPADRKLLSRLSKERPQE